jgi:hypothetical protein
MYRRRPFPLKISTREESTWQHSSKSNHFPASKRFAPETIEKHDLEQQLRAAQYALDVQLHDLRAEFLHREAKLRQDYLDRVAAITAGEWATGPRSWCMEDEMRDLKRTTIAAIAVLALSGGTMAGDTTEAELTGAKFRMFASTKAPDPW